MTRNERKALQKELGPRKVANRVRKLSTHDATKPLVTVHADMTPNELFALSQYAKALENANGPVTYSGGELRVDKTWREKVDTVLDNEDRFRRYGY